MSDKHPGPWRRVQCIGSDFVKLQDANGDTIVRDAEAPHETFDYLIQLKAERDALLAACEECIGTMSHLVEHADELSASHHHALRVARDLLEKSVGAIARGETTMVEKIAERLDQFASDLKAVDGDVTKLAGKYRITRIARRETEGK